MSAPPPPFARALDYANPVGLPAGPGVWAMVKDFVLGNLTTSAVGYAALSWYVTRQPRSGLGLEGIVLIAVGIMLVAMNTAMAGAVWAGAAIKKRTANGPVAVRPRRVMFYFGLFAVPIGSVCAWVVPQVLFPFRVFGLTGQLAVASAPIVLITWLLARPVSSPAAP